MPTKDITGVRRAERKLADKPKVCAKCGSRAGVNIHHKDGNQRNNASSNLQMLCKNCHAKAKGWPHRPKGAKNKK